MKEQELDRRKLLGALAAGAGAGAAAVGGLTSAKADGETNDEKRRARYKETDHVRAFYRVNRYPS
jgi:hypothetical protein